MGRLAGVEPIHTDALLHGWAGLPGLGETIVELLGPLARDEASRWRRWDWFASDFAEWHDVEPAPVLVLEGVGSGAASYDEWITTLVWVEADRDERLARGLARDGESMRANWVQWLDDEAALHERDRTRQRADLRYSTDA